MFQVSEATGEIVTVHAVTRLTMPEYYCNLFLNSLFPNSLALQEISKIYLPSVAWRPGNWRREDGRDWCKFGLDPDP